MKRRPAALSIRPEEYVAAKARANSLNLNFSAYVNSLIRADMQKGGSLVVHEVTTPPPVTEQRQETTYTKPKRAKLTS